MRKVELSPSVIEKTQTKITICRESAGAWRVLGIGKYKVVTKVGKAWVIRCQMIIPINWRHFHTESHCCDDDWGQLEAHGGILGEKTFYCHFITITVLGFCTDYHHMLQIKYFFGPKGCNQQAKYPHLKALIFSCSPGYLKCRRGQVRTGY